MSFFETIKELWKNERGRAIIKLGIYILFLMFAISYVRIGTQNSSNKVIVQDNYINKNVYQEKISFLDNIIILKNNGSDISFDLNNEEYKVVNNSVYKNDILEEYDFYFWNLTPSFIGNIIKNKEVYSETKYNDSSVEKTYKISLRDFMLSFNGKDLNLEEFDDNDITISIKQLNNEVISVNLDLTSYYNFIELGKELKVSIEY